MMAARMFADGRLQAQYDDKGYVVVDLLDSAENASMLAYLAAHQGGDPGENIFVSVHGWPAELNLAMTREVVALTQAKVQHLLPGWKVDGASFIVKPPGHAESRTGFMLHQDYNMVDEADLPSLGLWIALVDTGPHNGGLFALPGSHRKFAGTLRGANMPSFAVELDHQLRPLIEDIPVKAGQACIFAHSLFHGSLPNTSPAARPVIHAGMFAPDSRPLHYLREVDADGREYIDVLEIDRSYYYQQVVEFIKEPRKCPHTVVGRLDRYRPRPTRGEILLAYGVMPEEPAAEPVAAAVAMADAGAAQAMPEPVRHAGFRRRIGAVLRQWLTPE